MQALSKKTVAVSLLLVAAGVMVAYWDVLLRLVQEWGRNENYSHGFLIVPISAFLTWERRDRLRARPLRPSALGFLIILVGVGALAGGVLGAELFTSRVSLIVVLVGAVVALAGWGHLRILAFPLAFLLLMIPIPAIVFNQIAFPLQLLASRLGAAVLWLVDIPVFRQGNIITLANVSLEVAEACSGIRSLVSLLTLSIVYAYITEHRRVVQVGLVVATVPIAIFTNALRVAAIGIGAHYHGPQAAEGAFHSATGWLVFVAAFGLLLGLHNTLRYILNRMPAPALPTQPAQMGAPR